MAELFKRKDCPACGSDRAVPIVYGYPGPELLREAEEGKVFLGGCEVLEGAPDVRCLSCGHEWLAAAPG